MPASSKSSSRSMRLRASSVIWPSRNSWKMYSRSAAINSDLSSAAAKAGSSSLDAGSGNRPPRLSRRELLQPAFRHLQCCQACSKLGLVLALTLGGGVASQPEPAHDARQQQSLANQGHDDHAECDEEDEIAVGKRRTDFRGERNSERRRERNDAAHADECEGERPLPGRQRVPPGERGAEPAR